MLVNFNLNATPGINNGLAMLSAVLKKRGHSIELLFLNEAMGYTLDKERIIEDVRCFNPDIIGISLIEPQFKYMVKFLQFARSYWSGFVVCGGAHPTMDPDGVLSVEGVDAVCVGEGEGAIVELADRMAEKKSFDDVRNIFFKREGGSVLKNRLRPFMNLNSLPSQDNESFCLKRLLPLKNYQLEVLMGRGCAHQCSYCINGSYMKKYRELCDKDLGPKDYVRVRNADTVIGEIENLLPRYPEIKKIAFIDDNLLVYRDFLKGFLELYRQKIGLPFMCNANPESFTPEKARMLKEAGCDDVRFGLESGSERVKKHIMNRPISNDCVTKAFNVARQTGLMTSSFNMIGVPTETKSEVFDTLRLNAMIAPETVKFMTFYPFKSTPIYDMCEDMDLIDYEKKERLNTYDTFTCLKFSEEHQLFLKKVQTIFSWYLNIFLGGPASGLYEKRVKEIELMGKGEWDSFDFYGADKKISKKLRAKGVTHYSCFVNRSLAVKFPSKHFVEIEHA